MTGQPTDRPDDATTYRRTQGGRMVHMATCRYAKNGSPWRWADRVSFHEMCDATGRLGIYGCTVCKPFRHPDTRAGAS